MYSEKFYKAKILLSISVPEEKMWEISERIAEVVLDMNTLLADKYGVYSSIAKYEIADEELI